MNEPRALSSRRTNARRSPGATRRSHNSRRGTPYDVARVPHTPSEAVSEHGVLGQDLVLRKSETLLHEIESSVTARLQHLTGARPRRSTARSGLPHPNHALRNKLANRSQRVTDLESHRFAVDCEDPLEMAARHRSHVQAAQPVVSASPTTRGRSYRQIAPSEPVLGLGKLEPERFEAIDFNAFEIAFRDRHQPCE